VEKTKKYLRTVESEYLILERIGTHGEIRVLPRSFRDYGDALNYLEEVYACQQQSPMDFKAKNINYFISRAERVEFF